MLNPLSARKELHFGHSVCCVVAVLVLCSAVTNAQVDVKSITVNVDPGTSLENNVGAGFSLLEKEVTQLNVHLTSSKTIKSSSLVASAPGANWTKVTETHWRAAGIGTNDEFWCIILCIMDNNGGGGSGPILRWMSVSHVDMDADTDNDSQNAHRPPSRSEAEDEIEYPGVVASDVLGLLIPVNDNIDVSSTVRDGSEPMSRSQDPDVIDHVLEVRPRKAGEWYAVFLHGYQYVEDGTDVLLTDTDLGINEDITLNLRLESSWNTASGTTNTASAYYFPNTPRAQTYTATDMFEYIVLGCDIDVDSNNATDGSGRIAESNEYDEGEDFLEAHDHDDSIYNAYPEYRLGMLVPVNDDDDDADGEPDNGWNGENWSGPNGQTVETDDDDPQPGILMGLGVSSPDKVLLDALDPKLVIKKVSGDGAVRLFRASDDALMGILNNDEDGFHEFGGQTNWLQLYNDDMAIRVEGLRAGEVIIGYQLWVSGAILHHDEVRVTNVQLDLDVNNDTDLSDDVDGVINYLPGCEGTVADGYTPKVSTGTTFSNPTYAGQCMTLVLQGIGKNSKIDEVVFEITSTSSVSGFCVNATDAKVTGTGKEKDYSFKELQDDDTITITSSSTPTVSYGGKMEDDRTWVRFWCKDYGGKCKITATLKRDGDSVATYTLVVPLDSDTDDLADIYEKMQLEEWKTQYNLTTFDTDDLTFFAKNSDKELKDPDG